MNCSTLRNGALPSLLDGISRRPLPAESSAALATLSLVGQVLRFERPPAPQSFAVETEICDDRTIVPDTLRRPMIRLLGAKVATDHPARALARTLDRLRMRPHPFDLPALDTFVRGHAEKLGPTARHWAGRQKPDADTQSYFDPPLLDDTNWAEATLSRRVAYLERRRAEDTNAARALVEPQWAEEEADARFRLLQAFQTGLSATDQPFLNALEKDRAPRVRTLAARLLVRLGVSDRNPALAACVERIKRGQRGLLRKRPKLELELPANVKDQAGWRWILQTFQDVSLSELAGAFSLSEDEVITAAEEDEPLLLALALMATNERRFDILELIVAKLPNAWGRMFESGLDTLGAMPDSERQRWQEVIVMPYRKDPPIAYPLWDWLHRITDGETTAPVMSIVLDSKLLTRIPDPEHSAAPWAELMAALCPAALRQELRGQLAGLEPSQAITAVSLLEILEGMESVHV